MGIIADSTKISIPNNVVIPKKYINKKYITSEILGGLRFNCD